MSGYGSVSLWMDTVDDDLTPRPQLSSDIDVDVAIVGAGYTGLWTAYYLAGADRSLRVMIVERDIAGYGASGRNGGWCSALFAPTRQKVARAGGRAGVMAMNRTMVETLDEIERAITHEGIDCHFERAGTLTVATSPTHVERVRRSIDEEHSWGSTENDHRWLTADEARAMVEVRGCLGAAYTPHCAVLHPARLIRGLARAVERRGVPIYERTAATSIEPGRVETTHGTIEAPHVVRATEGYTSSLPGHRRTYAPIYSLMIATEPLPDAFWNEVGWSRRVTIDDGRHLIIYAQRTADGRIALGGRGAPYHFGSRVRPGFDKDPDVFVELEQVLFTLWPGAAGARITHRWGGPVGVPRDWFTSVGRDPGSGLAWAGGYVGDGVSTTNLAGRTLRDLILEHDTELTHLPWVNHRSRKWEPEPLRWIGINAALKTFESADRAEKRRGRTASRRVALVDRLIGF